MAVLRAEGREGRLEERQRRRGRMELRGGHAQRAEAQQPSFPRVARAGHAVRVVRRVHGIGEERRVVLAALVVGFPQNQGIHEERPRHVGQKSITRLNAGNGSRAQSRLRQVRCSPREGGQQSGAEGARRLLK